MAELIRRWLERHVKSPYLACNCEHDYDAHLHYRSGRDCSLCDCRSYRTPDMSEMRGGPHAC